MKKIVFFVACFLISITGLYSQNKLVDIHYDKPNNNLKLETELINLQEQYLMFENYIVRKENELRDYFVKNADEKIQKELLNANLIVKKTKKETQNQIKTIQQESLNEINYLKAELENLEKNNQQVLEAYQKEIYNKEILRVTQQKPFIFVIFGIIFLLTLIALLILILNIIKTKQSKKRNEDRLRYYYSRMNELELNAQIQKLNEQKSNEKKKKKEEIELEIEIALEEFSKNKEKEKKLLQKKSIKYINELYDIKAEMTETISLYTEKSLQEDESIVHRLFGDQQNLIESIINIYDDFKQNKDLPPNEKKELILRVKNILQEYIKETNRRLTIEQKKDKKSDYITDKYIQEIKRIEKILRELK